MENVTFKSTHMLSIRQISEIFTAVHFSEHDIIEQATDSAMTKILNDVQAELTTAGTARTIETIRYNMLYSKVNHVTAILLKRFSSKALTH